MGDTIRAITGRAASAPPVHGAGPKSEPRAVERQITSAPHGHVLTNIGVWSRDGKRIVYDVRSTPAGDVFDGTRIEEVDVETGEVRLLYESKNGAACGVVTTSPVDERCVFIHGPERPTRDWQYGPAHRQGVMVERGRPGVAVNLDARDLAPPFTPGALRGGSHVHTFSGDGRCVSFTYNDAILEHVAAPTAHLADADIDQRNIGVSFLQHPVAVSRDHPRNHDGVAFSVLVTRTTARPRPGSDEIAKACEEGWVGANGYLKPDGTRQARAIAFRGDVLTDSGQSITEAFIADLPEDLTIPGDGPLQGTTSRRPLPPKGTVQRRLTRTQSRRFPGLQGVRHWMRSSPDGSRIAMLMKDDGGVVQIWTISPNGGEPQQVTRNPWSIASAFSWSPDGRWIAYVADNSVFVTHVATGRATRLLPRSSDAVAPRPEACVFSPDGRYIAYVRHVSPFNQIFVAVPA